MNISMTNSSASAAPRSSTHADVRSAVAAATQRDSLVTDRKRLSRQRCFGQTSGNLVGGLAKTGVPADAPQTYGREWLTAPGC